MNMIAIYKIVNKFDGKLYIGSSVDVERRFKTHKDELNSGKHNNKHLQNAWNKYGAENFDFLIIEELFTADDLRDKETYYIQKYNCTNHDIGYNMLNNSNIGLGVSVSEEVKRKISEACKGCKNGNYGKRRTEEQKKYMRDKRWGKDYVCRPKKGYTKKSPDELAISRKRMSELATGRKHSDETKEKLRQLRLGKKASPELRAKFSDMRKGEKNSNSKLTKQQVLEIYEKMNNGVNYKEVCKEYGVNQGIVYKIKRKEHWVFK